MRYGTSEPKTILTSSTRGCMPMFLFKDMPELVERAIMLDDECDIWQKLQIDNITPIKKRIFFL